MIIPRELMIIGLRGATVFSIDDYIREIDDYLNLVDDYPAGIDDYRTSGSHIFLD